MSVDPHFKIRAKLIRLQSSDAPLNTWHSEKIRELCAAEEYDVEQRGIAAQLLTKYSAWLPEESE